MMRRVRWILWGLVAVLAAGWLWLRLRPPAPAPVPAEPVAQAAQQAAAATLGNTPAPGFRLTDQFGRPVSLGQFRGKVVVLTFIDSQCTTLCPLTSQILLDADRLLGPAAAHVQLMAINANPTYTAVRDVYQWSASHDMLHRWLFLTGPRQTLQPIWKAYGVSVNVVQGLVDHTAATYVITPAGRESWAMLTSSNPGNIPTEAAQLARHIARVMPAGPVAVAPVSILGAAPFLPHGSEAGRFRLTGLTPAGAPTTVTVGRGSPRLVAFFATWCQSCRQDLTVLKAYQTARASNRQLPPVVAVDLRVAEPSGSWVRQFVVTQHLNFPVGLDTRGSVADAFGVTALPDLAVVSARGKILWQHVGALPLPALQQAVLQALRAP